MTPTNLVLILPHLDPVSLQACRQVNHVWNVILRKDTYYLHRFEHLGVEVGQELSLRHVKALLPLIPSVAKPDNAFISLTLRVYSLFGRITEDFVLSFACEDKICSLWKDFEALVFQIKSKEKVEEICYIHPPFSPKGWYLKTYKPGSQNPPEIEPITNDVLAELATRSEIGLFRRALASQNP